MSADSFLRHQDVSRETLERLQIFAALLEKWNPKINLVSKHSLPEIWTRHFLDSAQLFDIAPTGNTWVDIGSGGGFPALVLACMSVEAFPDRHFTLIESDQRKCVFLRTVVREAGLNASVVAARAETLPPMKADILSARALAPLVDLLLLAERHLSADGIALFQKGGSHAKELALAQEAWQFDVRIISSKTEPSAVIFVVKDIARA